MEAINLVISDSERWYKILKPIGTWGPDFSLIVYEALILDPALGFSNRVPRVAFKMIKDTDDFQDFHEMVVDDVNRSTRIVSHDTSCILPIFKPFYSEIKGDITLCIVLPYDSHVVSLRSLLSNNPRFTGGIDDKCIGIVLAEVLQALEIIHKKGNHHMQITAGNIFYSYRSGTIQLAYAASAYERDTTLDDGNNVCSLNNMLAWGVAPEVKDEESMEFVDTYHTAKSDIWLVGIAALELAYGKIQVKNRRELLEIASYINEVKILPNTWEELRHKSAELIANRALPIKKRRFGNGSHADRALPIKKRRFGNGSHASNTAFTEVERRLSACFGSFVATCLDTDVGKRPSAEQLKTHVFLEKNVDSVRYFREVIVKEKNLHVARFFSRKLRKLGPCRGTGFEVTGTSRIKLFHFIALHHPSNGPGANQLRPISQEISSKQSSRNKEYQHSSCTYRMILFCTQMSRKSKLSDFQIPESYPI